MKVCVLGNSHIGAFKRALPETKPESVKPTFFGVGGRGIRQLRRDGTRLIPTKPDVRDRFMYTSGGLDVVDLAGYDAFLLVGSTFGISRATSFCRNCRLSPTTEEAELVSPEFIRQGVASYLFRCILLDLARAVSSVTDAPLVIVPDPLPSSKIKNVPDQWWWRDSGAVQSITKGYRDALTTIGRDFTIVEQPQDTVTEEVFTRDEFTIGPGPIERMLSPGLSKVGPEGDLHHMNSRFGTRMWQEVLPFLR